MLYEINKGKGAPKKKIEDFLLHDYGQNKKVVVPWEQQKAKLSKAFGFK